MPRLTPRRARRGFTLAELLVTIVVLAIIGTLLTTTMLGQQRQFQHAYGMVEVRRELRTAMSLVPTDMRGLSTAGGDVLGFSSNALRFRANSGSSIVCARSGSSTIDLPPLQLAQNTLTAWTETPSAGDVVFIFDEGALRGAEDDAWRMFPIESVTQSASACPGAPFTHPTLDAGKPRFRVTVTGTIPATVVIGAGVRFAREMVYSLEQSTETGRWYLAQTINRGGTWSDPVFVSGPYDNATGSGLRLAYFDSTGVQVPPGGAASRIARVDLSVRAVGTAASAALYEGGTPEPRDSLTFRMAVRNRQ